MPRTRSGQSAGEEQPTSSRTQKDHAPAKKKSAARPRIPKRKTTPNAPAVNSEVIVVEPKTLDLKTPIEQQAAQQKQIQSVLQLIGKLPGDLPAAARLSPSSNDQPFSVHSDSDLTRSVRFASPDMKRRHSRRRSRSNE